jgi:hypothetical protein
MVHQEGNKVGRFLDVAAYTEGGRQEIIWIVFV